MKIIIEKEVEVELPNDFYWDQKESSGFLVQETSILRVSFIAEFLSAEVVHDDWILNTGRHIWVDIHLNPDRKGHKKIEKLAYELAEFYGVK